MLALDAAPMAHEWLEPGYFIVEEQALARWPAGCAVDRLGDGTANGRRFAVLRLAPPGCRALTGGAPSAG